MRYLIIGLGIFGENPALDLTALGNEVIGADRNQARVDDIKDSISTVYHIDSTEESSLSVLPLKNVDIVVVAIGENFGASVRTVALLRKAGVKHIFARATDSIHQAILEGFHVDRILMPEQSAAQDLTREMEIGPDTCAMPADDERLALRLSTPAYFFGMKYSEMKLSENYGLTLVAVARPGEATNILGISHSELRPVENPEAICTEGDVITVFGYRKAIRGFLKSIS